MQHISYYLPIDHPDLKQSVFPYSPEEREPGSPNLARSPARMPGDLRSWTSLASSAYLGNGHSVEVFGGLLKVKSGWNRERRRFIPRTVRGTVKGFSHGSRRRLLRTLAEIDFSTLSMPTMCTLTFHRPLCDRSAWRSLQNWFRAIRHRYPKLLYIWRMELQRRGAVHFHVILWLPRDLRAIVKHKRWNPWLSEIWHRVADPESEPHTRHGAMCSQVGSITATRGYLSKYISKEDEERADLEGRRWGTSRNLPRRPLAILDLTSREHQLLRRIIKRMLKNRSRNRRRLRGYVQGSPTLHIYVDAETVLRILTEVLGISPDRILVDSDLYGISDWDHLPEYDQSVDRRAVNSPSFPFRVGLDRMIAP